MIDIPDSIFPVDGEGRALCPKCKKIVSACDCPSYEPPKPKGPSFISVIRMEKSGRKGKTVTLIEKLPRDEKFLEKMAKDLKIKTGSGGTFYVAENGGVVEIQGDHRKMIEKLFRKGSFKREGAC